MTRAQTDLAALAVEHLPDAVMVVGDGEVLLANAALCRLVVTDPGDVIGRPPPRLPPAGWEASSTPVPLPDGGTGELVVVRPQTVAAAGARREVAELERLATTDGLTGLLNQRAFPARLEEQLEAGPPLALVVLDLDHFKRINDTHGHPAGDDVLREAATRLRSVAREADVLARIGGEEFAWVLPGADPGAALEAAERLRAAFAITPFADGLTVTASIGVCATADAGRDPATLVTLADRALYWAKACGRDTVLRWTPETAIRLADAFDATDPVTLADTVVDRGHGDRVAQLAFAMAGALDWSPRAQARLHQAARLHDLGKAAVPGELLDRPGPLSPLESRHVGRHAGIGATLAAAVLDPEQVDWIRHHHERWDGAGYPDRLVGDAIPEGAQLLALADAWDAMTRPRPYCPARTEAEALAEVERCAGAHFRPDAPELIAAALAFERAAA